MKLGLDVDGVLADFNTAMIQRVVNVTGRDLFPPRPFDIPVWDYPEHYGYSQTETSATWEDIRKDEKFWLNIHPYNETERVLTHLFRLSYFRDADTEVYFITARPGIRAKAQTERWLRIYGFDDDPTVLISPHKGLCATALNLDRYIDDKTENAWDVALTGTTTFLMDRPWNRNATPHATVRRVNSVLDMLH